MENEIKVSDIHKNETAQAAASLSRAFQNDPMMRWLIPNDEDYQRMAIPLFETWVKYAVLYGKALRTENFEAIALRKKPGDIEFSFWRGFRSGMLKTPKILGKEAFDKLMWMDKVLVEEKKKNMADRSFWYCWTLGTDPQYQRQGFGSAVMQRTFDLATKDGLPCYLETVNPASKAVHEKKGYKLLSQVPLQDSGHTLYTMLREIDKNADT